MLEIARLVLCKRIIILFLFLLPSFLQAQIYPDQVVDSLLRLGISHIVTQDYAAAEKVFTKLKHDYTEIPLGKIYLAANQIAEAYDYAQEFDEDYILKNLEDAKDQAELLLEKNQANIWYRYFYALAEGYIAYFEAINGSWFSALSSGVNSISEFEKILDSDNNFFEAYIAIGTFEYWKSRKMEFMDWLPFTNDTKKSGIDRLNVAIDSSSYNTYLAINSLIWIYIDQKKFDAAIKIAENSLKQFPDSRTFKWGLARAYEESDSYKAIKIYKEILYSYPSYLKENYKNKIVLKHLIAQQYAKKGDNESAIKYCDEILSIKDLPESTKNELNERLERVRALKIELSK